jgi:hypothetical protein
MIGNCGFSVRLKVICNVDTLNLLGIFIKINYNDTL